MERVELLAPAATAEGVALAIASGADAVYFGGRRFNARQAASRMDGPELRRAIALCRGSGVRAYATVNTLVPDRELGAALALCDDLYSWGADALILQDLGLASLAAERYRGGGMELHASTQANLGSTATAQALASLGLSRGIAARELSLAEVAAIVRGAAPFGVEVFAHGALCFARSGLCYLSGLIGKRSGNRGLCAQPCRFDYRLEGAAGAPKPLSTRELRTAEGVGAVLSSGVRALKLEGRSRDERYAHVATSVYRRLIDSWCATGEAAPTRDELRSLAVAFDRGFTRGRLLGDGSREVLALDKGISQGLLVGRVARADPRRGRLSARLCAEVRAGDALAVATERGGVLFQARAERGAPEGSELWLPLPSGARPPEGRAVHAVSTSAIERSLGDARRRARALQEAAPPPRPPPSEPSPLEPGPGRRRGRPLLRARLPTGADPGPFLAAGADQVILTAPSQAERLEDFPDGAILALPPGLADRHRPLVEGLAERFGERSGGLLAGDLGTLSLLSTLLPREKVLGDLYLNLFSLRAVAVAAQWSGRLCLSQELTLAQAASISRRRPPCVEELEVLAGGPQPAMETANCLFDGVLRGCRSPGLGCSRSARLLDRTGRSFQVGADGFCGNAVFNAYPLFAADRVDALLRAGVDVLRLDLRAMGEADGQAMVRAYRRALDGERVPPPPPNTFTRGHLFRPVL